MKKQEVWKMLSHFLDNEELFLKEKNNIEKCLSQQSLGAIEQDCERTLKDKDFFIVDDGKNSKILQKLITL